MINLQESITHGAIAQPETLINAWNPPWLMLLFVPLGLLPFNIAMIVWTFINALLIGLIMIFSWQIATNNQPSRGILSAFIAGYFFAITISYLVIGQITVLVLLGMLLSIWLIGKGKDIFAGTGLVLTIIKPQTSYLFLLILIIWVINNRRWKVIEGFIVALVTTTIIFWIFDPSWVTDYYKLIGKLPFSLTYTSTIGSFFAAKLNTKVFYFASIMLLLLIKPLLRIQGKYGWLTTLNLSLLVSLPFSPYGFVFDQILLLPAIIQIISWVWNGALTKRNKSLIIGLMVAFYMLALYMLSIPILEYYWFFVLPLLLLLIFLITWRMSLHATTPFVPDFSVGQ
jgi:hypothetical protein